MIKGLCVKPTKGDAVLFWSMVSVFTYHMTFLLELFTKISSINYSANVGLVAFKILITAYPVSRLTWHP